MSAFIIISIQTALTDINIYPTMFTVETIKQRIHSIR